MTLERLLRDTRFAIRTLSRTPAFALIAILSLALGIGANTAIFSLVNGLLFTKPSLPNSASLVELHRHRPGEFNAVSQHDLDDLREGAGTMVTGLSAYLPFTGQIGGESGPGTVVLGELVDAEYFRILGVEMAMGRGFLDEEDRAALASPVVVIGHRLWRNALGGRPQVVGSQIRLNGRQYTVVGVAPERFASHTGGIRVDVWAPLAMADHLSPFDPSWDNLFAIGRLSPGTSAAAFSQAMESIATLKDSERGRSQRTWKYSATSFDDIYLVPSFDNTVKAVAVLLLVVVALVLLVTCSNLAGFLLARAMDRRKEMAVRMAIGASRAMAVSQMIMEAVLLSLAGGAAGILLSRWLISALLSMQLPLPIPLNIEIGVDWRVLLYTLGASVAAALLFGVIPALRATSVSVAPVLRDEAGGSSGRAGRLRNLLIAGQLAMSLLLLVTAGLFISNMKSALSVDPGFSTAPAGVLTVDLRGSGYRPDQYEAAYHRIKESIETIRGVREVSVSDRIPMMIGNAGGLVTIPGIENAQGRSEFYLESSAVSPEYFRVLGIPLRQGQEFTDAQRSGTAGVAIINSIAAERFYPRGDAVGRVVFVDSTPLTIVGISETARDRGLVEAPRRMIYTPLLQSFSSRMIFVARGEQPAARLADDMRRAALAFNADLFVVDSKTLDQHLGVIYFLPRMAAWIMSGFAVLALILGCIGLYGAVSHAVVRRSPELAIRLALGATPGSIVKLVVRSAMVLVVAGAVVGLAMALAASGFLGQFLIGGRGFNPLVFGLVTLVLALVALLASWLPARRAGRVNAMSAMRGSM